MSGTTQQFVSTHVAVGPFTKVAYELDPHLLHRGKWYIAVHSVNIKGAPHLSRLLATLFCNLVGRDHSLFSNVPDTPGDIESPLQPLTLLDLNVPTLKRVRFGIYSTPSTTFHVNRPSSRVEFTFGDPLDDALWPVFYQEEAEVRIHFSLYRDVV